MNLFPLHHGGDCWSCSHKELFFLFVRILLLHLKVTKADELRREVKETIAQCRASFLPMAQRERNASSTSSASAPGTTSTTAEAVVSLRKACHQSCGITVALYDQLRRVVPDDTWRETEGYVFQYLHARLKNRSLTTPTINHDRIHHRGALRSGPQPIPIARPITSMPPPPSRSYNRRPNHSLCSP